MSEACTAMLAVSRSRISPTMMMSGSARRSDRSITGKVTPMAGCTCTCRRWGWVISTGSSTVQTFFSIGLTRARSAWSVVVFPEPVGPTVRMIP